MGYLEFLVHFYLTNHARVVKFPYLNFTPLNLYPTSKLKFCSDSSPPPTCHILGVTCNVKRVKCLLNVYRNIFLKVV